jgi:hypothetical protein
VAVGDGGASGSVWPLAHLSAALLRLHPTAILITGMDMDIPLTPTGTGIPPTAMGTDILRMLMGLEMRIRTAVMPADLTATLHDRIIELATHM